MHQIGHGPAEHHNVLDVQPEMDENEGINPKKKQPKSHDHGGNANALEDWANLEHAESANRDKLAPGSFQDEQGNPTEEDGDDVGNEESATAVLVAQVGKSPHIAQPNGLKIY